ncbi:MAG: hypothetical protein J6T88_07625 [Bacteroidales bacterium]|nr:hypothetical protein [Bacteroidales bacterium]
MAKATGFVLKGRLKKQGITVYPLNGVMIMRSARSDERRSNTRGQFIQRQRMRHTTALWQKLKWCKPMFSGGKSVYARFATLANRLPAVYVPCKGPLDGASFLMPDIPVSDGNLTPIKQRLGYVDGSMTLITNLKASDLLRHEKLYLYTVEQRVEGRKPQVLFLPVRELGLDEFVEVDGRLALSGEEFADNMKGWALVRVDGDRCSTQSIVTRCRLYEQYTTEEALQLAAESYGGLT